MGLRSLDEKCTLLATHEFFRELPDAILASLASHARTEEYAAGRLIFAKGDRGHGLLAVIAGLVRISVQSTEGHEVVLNRIGPKEIFGEIALLDGGTRTASAIAETKCRLLVLDRRDLLPLLHAEPQIGVKLLEVVSQRLRRTSEQVEDLSFEAVSLRLAKALLRLAERQGTDRMLKPRILITQKALGATVGVSRESVNKHLQTWRHAGIVGLEKGACILLKPLALQQLANHERAEPLWLAKKRGL